MMYLKSDVYKGFEDSIWGIFIDRHDPDRGDQCAPSLYS